jgi:hypothetical protein
MLLRDTNAQGIAETAMWDGREPIRCRTLT